MSVLPRDVVLVDGPDTFAFLQSLLSQDVDGMEDGEVRWSLLLQPQGKLDAAFRVVRVGDGAWLEVEAGHGAGLAAKLNRYRIRVRAEIGTPGEPWGLVALRSIGAQPPDVPATARALPPWAPGVPGVDVVGPAAALGALADVGLDDRAFEEERVRAGVPALGRELTPDVIPQEAGLDRYCVSFTKGCFLGQELVCRIDTRGHVNRHLRHLRPPGGVTLPVGAAVRAGTRVVGTVTSAVPDLALGYVRREVPPGAEVEVDGSPGPVRVEAVPAR